MKYFSRLLCFALIALVTLEHAAASPFGARSKASTPGSSTAKADKIAKLPRGGGILGTPVEFKHLATLYYSFYALNGVTAMPAPEASAATFPELRDKDSPGYVIYEHLGAISLSYAALCYFATTESRFGSTAIALSSLPMAYVRYKYVLANLGKASTASMLLAGIFIGCIAFILSGKGDADLGLVALWYFYVGSGFAGVYDPNIGVKVWGFPTLEKKSTKAFFIWFSALVAGYGVLALLMQDGRHGMKAIGPAAIFELLFMIDCVFVRKWNVGVAPPESNYVFLGIPLITALGAILTGN